MITATNYKDQLDPSLIRGGCLDIHINIPALDVTVRRKILRELLKELVLKILRLL
ncbi:MAG: hypothetical protein ACR5KV_07660 [Wolbachia sp.]